MLLVLKAPKPGNIEPYVQILIPLMLRIWLIVNIVVLRYDQRKIRYKNLELVSACGYLYTGTQIKLGIAVCKFGNRLIVV